jgi:serine/threonine-protein kinase
VGPKSSITQTGTVMGTPTHMSPEQATGGAIGPATDIYALGVVAFEMATGHLPFDAESSVQLMAKHVDHQPPKPSSLGPVSAGFERLILDMLEKKPDARPGAREIRERIGKLRGEPTPTQATGERVLVPSRETAPTVAVRRSDPAIEIGKTVAAATTPRPGDTVRNTTGDTTIDPPARRRPFALIGAAAVAVIGVALFFVLRGGDHAAERTPSIAPATAQPAEAPHPAPPVEAPQPAPAEPQPPAVVAQPAPSEPAKPPVTAKKPPHASHRPVPPAPAQGSAAVTPPVVAAPAQGSAAAPPPPHDVDAVRDPFASGGSK